VASLTVVMSGAGAYPGDDAPQLEMSTINDLVTEAEHRSREEYIAFKVEFSRRMWENFAFDENWVRRHVAGAYDRSYRPDGVYRQVIAGFISAGLWTAQRAIPAPTLVMHGSLDDVFTVDHAEATTSQIPGARLWIVKDMGHSMPTELWDDMVDRVSELASAS
jgi:pimeloyl-ACP methyl ester carboxylesterase